MGYLITFYQNQQQPQPRDREYFYCGAYFVFALWIALGIKGLLNLVQEKLTSPSAVKPAFIGVLVLSTLFVLGECCNLIILRMIAQRTGCHGIRIQHVTDLRTGCNSFHSGRQ